MRTLLAILAAGAVAGLPLHLVPAGEPASAIVAHHQDGPVVQLAILLDDSGSMQGLINQARAQLWEVVNQLGRLSRDGRRARLEVALYHYGDTPFLSAPLVPLSGDLDLISERLFTVNGGGGTECCGLVIHNALTQLAWSRRADALRLIVIAGNEPFTQGAYDWRSACREAAAQGVTVHAIHCGAQADGVAGMWQEGARLGGGVFACIDHNRVEPVIRCPQDEELAALNQRLNATYLPYGVRGREMLARQSVQDANAQAAAPAALAARAEAKAGGAYRNGGWDLVDAVKEGAVAVSSLQAAELPEALRGKDPAAIAAEIARRQAEREELQRRIGALAAARSAFAATEQRKLAATGAPSLGEALRSAVAAGAAQQGFTAAP